MRAKDRVTVESLAEERMTVPSLGGDGVVIVRPIGFGVKLQLALCGSELRAATVLAHSVRDEDGEPLGDVEWWDTWGLRNEDDFIELTKAACRVSAFDSADAKKD